jgi:GT2 family glycosyltransferase
LAASLRFCDYAVNIRSRITDDFILKTKKSSSGNGEQLHAGPSAALGYVDVFGYSSAAGGWFFNGWVPRPPATDLAETVEFLAQCNKSQCWGRATLAFYQREDLDKKHIGVIAFVPLGSAAVGALQYVVFSLNGAKYQAQSGHFTSRLLDQDIVDRVRSNLTHQGLATRTRDHLLAITSRRGFTGTDTLSAFSDRILLDLDHAILCPPDGVLLKGWYLVRPGAISKIRVRSGPLSGELPLEDMVRVNRPDVIAAVGAQYGFNEIRCGFIAYVPRVVSPGDVLFLEVEFESGELAFKELKLSQGSGLEAIRRSFEGVEFRSTEIDAAFDKTLGPAVSSINRERLRLPVAFTELKLGEPPDAPEASVIIPFYGRIDFLEYQLALFSRVRNAKGRELIYVLDDPGKHDELERLARSAHERFGVPFRALLLQSNLGFGAANNVGLRAARGRYVCFLNSDVFPIDDDWLERLAAGLQRNPEIGIIGARLLFEDGSVQHEGCYYRTLKEYGNWQFIEHLNKGRRPEAGTGIEAREAITGACMVLERTLAHDLGGFDEQFIIGDFEDSDLCLKAKALGRIVAVDLSVNLYHLERKSQHSPHDNWRRNLTLYNAWVHQRRWFTTPPQRSGFGGH